MKCWSYGFEVGTAKGCGRSWRTLWRATYWVAYDNGGNSLGSFYGSDDAVNAVFNSDYARHIRRVYGPYAA